MATLEPGDEKGDSYGIYKRPTFFAQVDTLFQLRIGNSNSSKDGEEVVGYQSVTAPLGEKTNHHCEERTLSHSSSLEKIHPSHFGGIQFKLNRSFDLCHFC